jgi:hypothetical protein
MRASNWHPLERGTLRGFFDLLEPSGQKLHECSLHVSGDSRWVGLPSKPVIDKEGRHRDDPAKPGKKAYVATVSIPDKTRREVFQRQALRAVDRLLAGGGQ